MWECLYGDAAERSARRIMGEGYFGIADVARVFGPFTSRQWLPLVLTPIRMSTLRHYARTHVLVPDIGMSLLEIRRRSPPACFRSRGDVWYRDEEFAMRAQLPRWRLVARTVTMREAAPSTRQLTFAIVLARVARGEQMFEDGYFPTADDETWGYGVRVCHRASEGLSIHRWYNG